MKEHDKATKRLEEEKKRLQDLRSGIEVAPDSSVDPEPGAELSSHDQHPADQGTETFEKTKDLAILEQIDSQLVDIEHAFKRIEDGTYGTCEACGNPIGAERLEALPAARFCIEDQAKAERGVGT